MRSLTDIRVCPSCADRPMRLLSQIQPDPTRAIGFEFRLLTCDACGHRFSETVKSVSPEPHLIPQHWRCTHCGWQMEIYDRTRPHPTYGGNFELLRMRCMGCGRSATA